MAYPTMAERLAREIKAAKRRETCEECRLGKEEVCATHQAEDVQNKLADLLEENGVPVKWEDL